MDLITFQFTLLLSLSFSHSFFAFPGQFSFEWYRWYMDRNLFIRGVFKLLSILPHHTSCVLYKYNCNTVSHKNVNGLVKWLRIKRFHHNYLQSAQPKIGTGPNSLLVLEPENSSTHSWKRAAIKPYWGFSIKFET